MFIVNFLPLMGTKRPMSPNFSRLIEPSDSHHPFISSCASTNLYSTLSPMHTINHPLITPLIPTSYTPPTSSPSQPLAFHVNLGSQPYTFPNPFNHAQLEHFPPPTLLVLIVDHDHTPQPTPISSTCLQPPLKVLCPTFEHQFINRGLTHH
jgi:hypothetical protein